MAQSYRIYGPLNGETSWSRVARGLYIGLQAYRQTHFFKTDELGHEIDAPLKTGSDADVGIFVGPPNRAGMMMGQGHHSERWLMLAPNSTWLPRDVLEELERVHAVTGYLSPSNWGCEVIRHHTDLPVRCFPHGVDTHQLALVDAEVPAPAPEGDFSVLHLSSTHLQRKGTQQLVEAWVQAMVDGSLPEGARLDVVLDGSAASVDKVCREAIQKGRRPVSGERAEWILGSVKVLPRLNLAPPRLASLMWQYHCVCQPSRAEGFGMVPLEARCVGVPVIMTNGTGHGMHVPGNNNDFYPSREGIVGDFFLRGSVLVVPQGSLAPSDDGPGAMAPGFSTRDLQGALVMMCRHAGRYREIASSFAPSVRERWSWQEQARRYLGEPRA